MDQFQNISLRSYLTEDLTENSLNFSPASVTDRAFMGDGIDLSRSPRPKMGHDHFVEEDRQNLQAFLSRSRKKKDLSAKRRSGSLGATASGSPIALKSVSSTATSPQKRQPLGQLDVNSPSPVKPKRKYEDAGEDQPEDPKSPKPQPAKRRRRQLGQAAVPDAAALGLGSVEVDDGELTVRRSGRRVALYNSAAALSTPASATSKIPVKLPGQAAGYGGSADLPPELNALKRQMAARSEAKDLAALTRQNTALNRGAALRPTQVLERIQRESSGEEEDKEKQEEEETGPVVEEGRRVTRSLSRRVGFAQPLARYQGEDAVPCATTDVASTAAVAAPAERDESPEETVKPAPAPAPTATRRRRTAREITEERAGVLDMEAAARATKEEKKKEKTAPALSLSSLSRAVPTARKKATTAKEVVEEATGPRTEGAKVAKAKATATTRKSRLPTPGTPAPRRSARTMK